MTALSDRIAAEHVLYRCTENGGPGVYGQPVEVYVGYQCECGWTTTDSAATSQHLADVTERAVRDAIVAELTVQADRWSDNAARHRADSIAAVTERGTRTHMQTAHAFRNKEAAMFDAIRTARGETST